MAEVRTATATWNGDLASGSGSVSAGTTGLFEDLPVSWGSRTGAPDGRTSPEELLAAAHAACFSMALSAGLARVGTPPEHLHVEAEVTFDKVGDAWTVTRSRLIVVGHVDGLSPEEFDAAAAEASQGCPISRALKGNVEISVAATLEQ